MEALENDFDAFHVLIGWQPFVYYTNKSKEKKKKTKKESFHYKWWYKRKIPLFPLFRKRS